MLYSALSEVQCTPPKSELCFSCLFQELIKLVLRHNLIHRTNFPLSPSLSFSDNWTTDRHSYLKAIAVETVSAPPFIVVSSSLPSFFSLPLRLAVRSFVSLWVPAGLLSPSMIPARVLYAAAFSATTFHVAATSSFLVCVCLGLNIGCSSFKSLAFCTSYQKVCKEIGWKEQSKDPVAH